MLKLRSVSFQYVCGDEVFCVNTVRSFSNDIVKLDITTVGDVFSADITAEKEITVTELRALFEYPFSESDKIFLNGYQSWTDSHEHGIFGKMRGIGQIPDEICRRYAFSQYGDYSFAPYGTKGELHGWSYGYIRNNGNYKFLGSLSEDSGFTRIETFADKGVVQIYKDCAELSFSGKYAGIRMLITDGTEDEVFDDYFRQLGVTLRPAAKPVFGYTSWYRHYQNINEELLLRDLEGIINQKCKADVFQIDDGWQTAVGDWLSVDHSKFPNGMRNAAERISAEGITPGLWLAPFVCEENSDIFQSHKDWLVRDDNGFFVKGGSNWSGFYALDLYNDNVRNYIREVIETAVVHWGFRLLKLDFLYAVCIQPRSDKTRGQIMAEAMDFLRDCAGDALILACGVPLASAFGRVEYCRIGCDVSLDWDDKKYMQFMHRERISTKNTVLDSVFRRQLNGRAFLNDPDVFLLRSDNTSMTGAQRQCLAEINSLTGSVLFTSDNMSEYGDEQLRLLYGINKLRSAKLLSADYDDGILTISLSLNGKTIKRNYRM